MVHSPICARSVVVNVLESENGVPSSHPNRNRCVHFRENIFGDGMNPFIPGLAKGTKEELSGFSNLDWQTV